MTPNPNTITIKRCKAAQIFAKHGAKVFPAKAGKKVPATPNGFKDATVDPSHIQAWFGDPMQDYNLAIRTGQVSGVLVLDWDKYKECAQNSLNELEEELGNLPPTFTQKTRADGRQYFFQYPTGRNIRCSAGKLAKGIDIRGEDGYVIGPFSYVEADDSGPAGWYEIIDNRPFAELPDAWIEALASPLRSNTQRTGAISPNSDLSDLVGGIGGFVLPDTIKLGTRNDALQRYLWHLLGRGIPADLAVQLVRDANVTRCQPPLEDDEVDLILRPENLAAGTKPSNGQVTEGDKDKRIDSHKGDLLNSHLAAKVANGSLKWIDGVDEWLAYTEEAGWTQAAPFAAVNNSKLVIELLKEEAARLYQADHESPLAKKLMAHIAKSSSLRAINAAVELSKAEPGMTCRLTDTDQDPLVIGLKNGVFDLRHFKLLGHDRNLMVTKRCNVAYDPLAPCPRFDAFIERVLPDAEVRGFVQRFFGCRLTGIVTDHLMIYMHGSGENGKSKLIETVNWVIGDYSRKIATEMLVRNKRNPQGPSPDLLALYGQRLIWANETTEGSYIDEARFKELTGGDTISARGLYAKRDMNFSPSWGLVIIGNYDLLVSDVSHAFWRRVAKVPFDVTITAEEKDPNLLEKLLAEGPGIFNWLLDGLREYRRIGLNTPSRIIAATQQYREDQDLIREFLYESGRVEIKEKGEMEKSTLYFSYRSWCEQSGLRPMSQKSLTRRLTVHGIIQDAGRRKYLGVAPV